MNYRHTFHAGNHCDVLKHTALCLILERLKNKEKPFSVLDTHAGRGLYDLESAEAQRSAEYKGGVGRLIDVSGPPTGLEPYLAAIRRQNPFGGLRWYPGSPVLIRDALREDDSLKLCELHPAERAALETATENDRRVRVFDLDGYQAVRAFLPPPERRGMVLIDPPFEITGEYGRIAKAVADALSRWAGGTIMVWHPLKDSEGYQAFMSAVDALNPAKSLIAELRVMPAEPDKLTGSALFIVNPTFGLAEALLEVFPFLAARLAVKEGASWAVKAHESGRLICDANG